MEGYIGEIRAFAGNYAPRGWAFCDGSTIQISDNAALFSFIGFGYGGDGRTNFLLPNLPPLAPTGDANQGRYIICLRGIFPSRA